MVLKGWLECSLADEDKPLTFYGSGLGFRFRLGLSFGLGFRLALGLGLELGFGELSPRSTN